MVGKKSDAEPRLDPTPPIRMTTRNGAAACAARPTTRLRPRRDRAREDDILGDVADLAVRVIAMDAKQIERPVAGHPVLGHEHTDRHPDPAYHRDLLRTGAYVEYDRAFRAKLDDANPTLKLFVAMVKEFPDRVMLGTDGARCKLGDAARQVRDDHGLL